MALTEEEREILRAQHRERVAQCTLKVQAIWKREAEERKKKLEEEAELKRMEEEEAEK